MNKFKHTVLFASAILVGTVLVSCKKQEIQPTSEEISSVKVTHHYIYGDQESTVNYEFNENNELVSSTGEIAKRDAFLMKKNDNGNLTLLVENVQNNGKDFVIRFFDSEQEMNSYQKVKVPTDQNATIDQAKYNPCYNNGWSGYASFRFYKHVNYVDEMTNLRRLNHAYFQIHYLDSYYENDQISSLKVSGGTVDLFEHGCFYGIQIRFLQSIPNLHWFLAATVYPHNSNDPVDYIGSRPSGFFPANYNFGDKASSIKGWSI
ncbi:MAG: hypothetical protein AB8B56_05470 [Crocinitomicaceae bacterium]